jgi:multicomponent Na+:H+ antiporter subunit B
VTPRQRALVAPIGAALLAGLMFWGALGLPAFGAYAGPYGDVVNAAAPVERQVQNVVTAINFDYRALDTLGEEYILFAAVAAAALLLRRLRSEEEDEEAVDRAGELDVNHPGEALHAWGLAMIGFTLLFGLYMVLHPVTSPGGGFQGGCVMASAWLLVFLSGDTRLLHRVTNEHLVQLAEALGAGAYGAVGLAMLFSGAAFLQNVLPIGTLGSPIAGGMMVVINAAVGMEVTAGFVLILHEFLRQTTAVRDGS